MEIEKTAKRIMKKTIHLRKILDDGTVEFEMINIIPYARYKDGVFKFRLNYSIIPYLVEINKNDCCCTTEDTASHTSEVSDELEHMATMISNKSELNCNDVEQSETNDNNDVEQSETNDNNDVEQSETNDDNDVEEQTNDNNYEGPALYTDEERTKLENYLKTFNKNL
jgi:hypothetical protein